MGMGAAILCVLLLATAEVLAVAVPRHNGHNHLSVVYAELSAAPENAVVELPLPGPGSTDGEGKLLMVRLRSSPSTSDASYRRFVGRLEDGNGVVRLTISRSREQVEGSIVTAEGRRLVYDTQPSASGVGSSLRLHEDVEMDDVLLSAADDEDNLFSGNGYSSSDDDERMRRRRDAEQVRPRRDLEAPLSDEHKICTVYVDVDATFLAAHGPSIDAAMEKVLDIMADVEAAYSDNLPSLDIRLRGVTVHGQLTPFVPLRSSSTDMLVFYQRWLASNPDNAGGKLRGANEPGPRQVCMNILLTHTSMSGVAGAAYTASTIPGLTGGICDYRILPPLGGATNDLRVWNVAVVTSLSGGQTLAHSTLVRAIAHELGHASGAPHTCCLGDSCSYQTSCSRREGNNCNPKDNYYLMYPALTNTPNSLTFSGCSAGSIATAVALRGSCLITKADADAIANVPGQGTTAMAEKTTPTIEPCLESLSPIGCYIFCRAEGFTFSLHVQTYKGCPNVCFCSMVEDGSIATPDASTTSTTAAATTSPTTTTTTTTPTPAAVTTAQSGYMRLVPCPTCGYNSPDNKRNGREDKNTKLKFRLKVNCPQGHAFHFCIKRRSEGDSINSILRAKHLNGLEIARVTVEVGEDYKCWSLVLPAAYASQDSIFFLKTKSDSYFQVQTNVAKVRSPLDCVAL